MRFFKFLPFLLIFFIGCDSDLTPDYILKTNRPLVLKFSNPEPKIDEEISAKILIGCKSFEQNSSLNIFFLGQNKPIKYYQPFKFSISEKTLKILSEKNPKMSQIYNNYKKKGFANIPFYAYFNLNERTVGITKYFRIHKSTNKNFPKNPEIKNVVVYFYQNENIIKKTIHNNETIKFLSIKNMPDYLGFEAVTKKAKETNCDELIYRWFFTSEKNDKINSFFKIEESTKLIKKYLNTNSASSKYKKMLLSLKSIKSELKTKTYIKNIKFSFYLIVKDHATSPKNIDDYRFGVDFFVFNIIFGE